MLELVKTSYMIHIVCHLYVTPIGKNISTNTIDIITQEKTIEDLLRENEEKKFDIQWEQSSTTDGKSIFTIITAFLVSN